MKKLLYTLLAAAATLFAVGCNKEADKAVQGGETVEASFQIGLTGSRTKASMSDGTTATQLVVGVYDREAGYVESLSYLPTAAEYKKAFGSDLSANFNARLVKGHGYDIVFLAVAPDNGVYTIDLAQKTFTAATEGDGNAEIRDAFYGVFSIEKVTGTIENQPVTLTRPFAQFNAISTKKDFEYAKAALASFGKSAMTITAPTVLNLLDGTVGTPAKYTFAAAAMPDTKPNFDPYKTKGDYWLMANYVLAGTESDIAMLDFTLYSESGAEMATYPLPSTPYKRNFRTNVYGSLLTTDGTFRVVIEPEYEGEIPFVLDAPEIEFEDSTLPAPGSKLSVAPGGTINFAAKHPLKDVKATYKSSDWEVGTIDEKGLFTAEAEGETEITISFPAVVGGVPVEEETGTKAEVEGEGEGGEESPAVINYPAVTYKYTVVVKEDGEEPVTPAGDGGSDVIDLAFTGVEGTSYADWSDKKGASGAVYAGNSAGGNSAVQLRSDNSKASSGVISTTSGGKLTKVAVEWNENTADGRELQVYGSNTAYTATADLYDEAKAGTLLGTIKKGTGTSLDVTGDYTYVGLRSADKAMYLDKITVTWGKGGTPSEPEGPVTATITASDKTVEVGKTVSIGATTNSTATITYTSKNTDIATVDASGVVTGVKAGEATITLAVAAVEDKFTEATKDIKVTVTEAGTPADPETLDLKENVSVIGGNNYTKAEGSTVNGETALVHKMGTGSSTGDVTVYLPEGTDQISFYAISWNKESTTMVVKVDGTAVKTITPVAKAGLAGSNPYTITDVTSEDYYTVSLGSKPVKVTIETVKPETAPEGFNAGNRGAIFGVQGNGTVEIQKDPDTGIQYKKATKVESGKSYVIVGVKDGKYYAATPIASNKTYGYLSGKEVLKVTDGVLGDDLANYEFTFTASGDAFVITQPDGRKIGTAESYASFQIVDEDTWTVADHDGAFKLTSAASGKYMQHGDGTYTTFGVYNEDGHGTYPFLYEKVSK